jgi:hypothetical protein
VLHFSFRVQGLVPILCSLTLKGVGRKPSGHSGTINSQCGARIGKFERVEVLSMISSASMGDQISVHKT